MICSLRESLPLDCDAIFHSSSCTKLSMSNHTCGSINFDHNQMCCSSCFKIEGVENFKYLGVLVDKNMTWKAHVEEVKLYMLSATRKMYLLREHCSINILRMFYYGIVHSKLQYGIASWGGTYNSTIEPLYTAQKYVIKVMCKKNRLAHSWPLFQMLRILPLRHLYVFKVLKVFFIRSGYSANLRRSDVYNLRINNMQALNIPFSRKTCCLKFFTTAAPRLFNKLPVEIRQIVQPNIFSKEVKKFLLSIESSSLVNSNL